MASNDPEPGNEVVAPASGPVAYLTRIIHEAATNDQTPVRVGLIVVIALALTATPFPWNGMGFVALVLLVVSLGHLTPSKR